MDLIERPGNVVRRHPWEVARARFFLAAGRAPGLIERDRQLARRRRRRRLVRQQLRAVLPTADRLACWDVHYPTTAGPTAPEPSPRHRVQRHATRGCLRRVLMLDVIEHVEDDVAFVRDVVEGRWPPGVGCS